MEKRGGTVEQFSLEVEAEFQNLYSKGFPVFFRQQAPMPPHSHVTHEGPRLPADFVKTRPTGLLVFFS